MPMVSPSQSPNLYNTDWILETSIEVKGTDSKPKDRVVEKGRGFLRKDVNSPGRLFNFGSN